jgi:DNA polymerase-3 subunit epsilon
MDKSIRSQSFRVLDTETTGLDPRTDAIVELAWAIMRGDGTVLSSNSTLINPGRHIPRDATTIHGITDRDVANAPTLEKAVEQYRDLHTPVLHAVCHNAGFDSVLL